MSSTSNMAFSDYLTEFNNFVLTKYSINGSTEAVYILHSDILKLDKICSNIIYKVRTSSRLITQFTRQDMLNYAEFLEFKDKLNILCKKWDEHRWNYVFRFGIGDMFKSVLDSVKVNGICQHIMFYKDLTNLFNDEKNYFMNNLKTDEMIENSHK